MNSWESEDLKFIIEITSPGFDMSSDEYEVYLKNGTKSQKVPESSIRHTDQGYVLCIDDELKKMFGTGTIYLVVYAKVIDVDFDKGYRREIYKGKLSVVNGV